MPIANFFGRNATVIPALMLASACGARPTPESQPRQQIDNQARAASEVQPPQPAPRAGQGVLDRLRLPPGFSIELYTDDVPHARSIALGSDGIVFVSTRADSRIYAVLDADGDRDVDQVITLLSGLDTPNGIAYRDGDLYVAEPERILRYAGIDERLDNPPSATIVTDVFPGESAHGWRYLRAGPDGYLYIGIGAPCNACMRDEAIFATIARVRPDGGDVEIFAHGVRNTLGFDWHPDTQELWFTDNGRDRLGDNVPPDELNRAPTAGLHFGFPHCHGDDLLDPVFGEGRSCGEFEPPVQLLGPHVAALGMRFYTGDMFPEQYRRAIIIAEHGSWDRSDPIGYRVMVVPLAGNEPQGYFPLVEGFLDEESGEAWGRPVDVAVLGDGSLLISDDEYGALYRVTHE